MSLDLKNKTLGIISSYSDNCGNASYTKQLMHELKPYFKDVKCIELDQNLKNIRGLKVKDIILECNKYDYINIQFEPGLFGSTGKAFKMIRKIIKNHNNITITFHSIPYNRMLFKGNYCLFWTPILNSVKRIFLRNNDSRSKRYRSLLEFIKRERKSKHIECIVHRSDLAKAFRLSGYNCYDHPIVSATNDDITNYNTSSSRDLLCEKYNLDKTKKYIGIFGFMGLYKGFDVAIRALSTLPSEYRLIYCVQKHPVSNTVLSKFNNSKHNVATQFEVGNLKDNVTFIQDLIRELHLENRIDYINHLLDEEDFKLVVAGVDFPVFSYYEIGQGGSGPITYAMHLNYGGKIIVSRTATFEEYHKYYKDCLHFIDQGNYLELASKIQNVQSLRENILNVTKNINVNSNIETYIKATTKETLWRMEVQ